MIRLRTLGSVGIHNGDERDLESLLAQPRRVALLVYLALATPRGFHRRDTLLALFWPEQDEAHARNALSQSVHVLRRTLGADTIISRADDELGLDWTSFWCDAIAFDAELDAGHTVEALELYRGPLLEGFHVSNAAAELDRWLEQQREHFAQQYAQALERMAQSREAAADHADAVTWRRKLAALDPYSSRAALGLMRALAAAGEPARAVQHARVHETLVREELGVAADPSVAALARELAAPCVSSPREEPAAPAQANVPVPASEPQRSPEFPLAPATARTHPRWRRAATLFALGGFVLLAGGAFALSRVRNLRGAPAINCLAVLPLTNVSRDSTQGYVADGITDAIITELARYERPTVISHTSTSRYRNTRKSAPEIARELHCDALVEGTVTREGERVRIAARLVRAPADRPLWSESYESDVTYLVALERQIAEQVAHEVRAVATAGDSASAQAPRNVDPLTYAIYLRARDAFMSRNPASLRQALALFRQVVDRDSAFAPGYSGLSDTYRFLGGSGYAPLSFWTDSAEPYARRALALDANSAEAHTSLASLLTDRGDWPAAEQEYRRAITLRPGYPLAHHWYAIMLVTLDRKADALREIRRASELDPLSQAIQGEKGEIEGYAGVRIPQSLTPKRAIPDASALRDPTHPGTRASRSVALARGGKCPEAYAENRKAQELAPDNTVIMIALANVHTFCGAPEKARAVLDSAERRPDARLEAVWIAALYAQRGEPDSAFAWLMNGQWGMQGRLKLRTLHGLDPLRADPRFPLVMHKAGLI
jgi:DNA-binding SARP family transcriptional activator/TolB-like protein/Flp pilus assembly protein TadD